ncbi:MAG TPA: hypothetical protein VGY98_14100, partial [Verrucomicrobiae bacterium]|nr:hypothetical protein [Verrucomicrobiae bacterium]
MNWTGVPKGVWDCVHGGGLGPHDEAEVAGLANWSSCLVADGSAGNFGSVSSLLAWGTANGDCDPNPVLDAGADGIGNLVGAASSLEIGGAKELLVKSEFQGDCGAPGCDGALNVSWLPASWLPNTVSFRAVS